MTTMSSMCQALRVEEVAQAAVVKEEEAVVDTTTEEGEAVAEVAEEAEEQIANTSITAAVKTQKIAIAPRQNVPSSTLTKSLSSRPFTQPARTNRTQGPQPSYSRRWLLMRREHHRLKPSKKQGTKTIKTPAMPIGVTRPSRSPRDHESWSRRLPLNNTMA
jgi:hypothetical protein